MSQILDAIGIALSSIWVNKIRSLMMVLGNIVAVTSIIAVVSLLQGMNGYVADAILRDVGAGTFKVDKTGVTTSREEEDDGLAPQPEHHDARRQGDRGVRPADHRLGDGGIRRRGQRHVGHRDAREHARPRRVGRLRGLQRLHGRTGPAPEPHRSRSRTQRRAHRLGHGRQAVQGTQPGRQGHPGQRHALHGARRQREEGLGLRDVAGRVRGDPAWRLPAPVRVAALARDHGEAGEPRRPGARDGCGARGDARAAPPASARRRQLRPLHVRHADGSLEVSSRRAPSRSSSASSRSRSSSAASSS